MTDTTVDWYGPDAATFGDRIAAAREHAGLSQAQLARRLGVRVDTVRAWEDDRSEPRANRLSMMAGLLSVSMMWLLNGEGDGLPPPGDEDETPSDLKEALDELRAVKAALASSNARLGRVEKRLRNMQVPAE